MRCIISYRRGPFVGVEDIGVPPDADENHERVLAAVANLQAKGATIIRIRFW